MTEISTEDLKGFVGSMNIADELDEVFLNKIGARVCKKYGDDRSDVSEWLDEYNDLVEMANQISTPKNFPWEGAANVKYPLIPSASIRFASSVYPEIIQSEGVVKPKVYGADVDDAKLERGERVSKFMNWQLQEQMVEWEDNTDKLLTMLPIVGCYFKKTFYSPLKRRNVSMLVAPPDLIISKYSGDFDYIPRITHKFCMSRNEVIERQRSEVFSDVDLPTKKDDEDTDVEIIEQHCWYDLDDDGYEEPYIITVELESKKVLRIVTRFDTDGVLTNDKDEVISIKPFNHFTKYVFFQSFDDSPYGIGFGKLLMPLNETINSTINQLLDAGTLDNLQGGLLGSGIRTEGGPFRLSPGEWQPVEVGSGSFNDNIFPIPTKGPSMEMLQLMQFLVGTAQDLASAKDVMSGDIPANAAATTVLAAIEQGYKVYSSIYKRIYKSLKEEFKKLYELTYTYGDPKEYANVLDEDVDFYADFEMDSKDLVPVANPEVSSSIQELVKAQAMIQSLDSPSAQAAGVSARAVYENYFKALKVEDMDAVLPPPPDPATIPPSIEEQMMDLQAQALQSKTQLEQIKAEQDEEELQIKKQESEAKVKETMAKALKAIAEAEAAEVGTQLGMYKAELEGLMAEMGGETQPTIQSSPKTNDTTETIQ